MMQHCNRPGSSVPIHVSATLLRRARAYSAGSRSRLALRSSCRGQESDGSKALDAAGAARSGGRGFRALLQKQRWCLGHRYNPTPPDIPVHCACQAVVTLPGPGDLQPQLAGWPSWTVTGSLCLGGASHHHSKPGSWQPAIFSSVPHLEPCPLCLPGCIAPQPQLAVAPAPGSEDAAQRGGARAPKPEVVVAAGGRQGGLMGQIV